MLRPSYQILVIKEAIDIVEHSNVYVAASDSLQLDLTTLEEEAKAAFGEREAALVLADLGSTDGRSISQFPNCTCSTQSDWCWWGWRCVDTGLQCIRQASGCGTLWIFPCNGLCQDIP
jgi:hypothetical protein